MIFVLKAYITGRIRNATYAAKRGEIGVKGGECQSGLRKARYSSYLGGNRIAQKGHNSHLHGVLSKFFPAKHHQRWHPIQGLCGRLLIGVNHLVQTFLVRVVFRVSLMELKIKHWKRNQKWNKL
jgi:hypothetical protein